MSTFAYDAFISYSRKDKSFVDFLVQTLERAELKCFQDTTGLKVFDKLDASLKAAIADSHKLIAVISPSYLQSYWCMFEALEAIQGQDLEQRFLPLIVRYTANDQTLDEDFVLSALADLDQQMNEFEAKLIKLRAYELAPKLEKLRFLRSNLPGLFRRIQERIFPEFELWDQRSTRTTVGQVLKQLAPGAPFDADALTLTFDTLAAQPSVVPRLQPLPTVIWKARIGKQAWKNSPLVVGNDVLVGSCGEHWNSPSAGTGIYCLDAETGKTKWFFRTSGDPNRLMLSKGVVVAGCDDGSVVAISARDGSLRWTASLDSGVVGGPIKLDANISSSIGERSGERAEDPLLVTTFAGGLFLLDLKDGSLIQALQLGGTTLGTPAIWQDRIRKRILVPMCEGRLEILEYSSIYLRVDPYASVAVTFDDPYAETGRSEAELVAEPAVIGALALVGLVRPTSYDDPPLVAVDVQAGAVVWSATGARGAGGFGNLRSPPVVVGNQAIFACAYTQGITAVSVQDGREQWSLDLGQGMFEQWSGPVADGKSIYIGRHDGYLHKVDVASQKREWSIYLGNAEHAGIAVAGAQTLPEFSANYAWTSGESAPILATPTLDRGRLYVGTHEGYLFALGNLGGAAAR